MQPFCSATTLLSVRVRRWLLRIVEASTLTLGDLVSLVEGRSSVGVCVLRSDVVHNDGYAQAVLAAEDVLEKRGLSGALGLVSDVVSSYSSIGAYQKARKEGHRESLRRL